VWFELKTSGFPMLAMGLGAALLIYLLFAASIPIEILRPFAIFSVMIFAPALLLLVSGNAFGIRRRQGRTYASAFELTQPYGTAGLVGLKLLVRTACVLVALAVAGASVWAASSLMGAWESWVVAGSTDAVPGLLGKRQAIADAFAGQTGYFLAVQAVIWSVCVALMVAFLAAISALRARYPRPMLIAGSLLLGHCLALVLVGFAKVNGIVSPLVAEIAFKATGATILLAMVLAIVYLFWSGFTQRVLTIRYATVAVLISAAFAAAWLTLLQAIGVQLSGTAVASALAVLWPVLLPPLASLLAPWSLSRLRHQ
jgi:hypothetical protein